MNDITFVSEGIPGWKKFIAKAGSVNLHHTNAVYYFDVLAGRLNRSTRQGFSLQNKAYNQGIKEEALVLL